MRRIGLALASALVLGLLPMGTQSAASAVPAERDMRAATATGTASQLLRSVPAVPQLRVGYKQGLFPNLASKTKDKRGCTLRNQMLITLAAKKPKVGAGCKLTGGTWIADFGRTVVTNPNRVRLAKLVPDVYVYGQGASAWTQAQRDAFTRVVPRVAVSKGKQTRLRPAPVVREDAVANLASFIIPITPKSTKFVISANTMLATNAEPTQAQLDALRASNPTVFKDWSLATLLNAKAWGLSLSPQLYANFQVSLTQCPRSLRFRPLIHPAPMEDTSNTLTLNPCTDTFTVTEAGQTFKVNVIPQIATTIAASDPEVLSQYGQPTGDVITRQLFGMHAPADWFSDVASKTEGPTDPATIPNVPVGYLRLWDTETTWKDIEPSRGQFVWRKLDRQIQTAQVLDAEVMLVLGQTPAWAGNGSPQSPPTSIDDWRNYVREVCTHVGPSVHAYEVWNEANLQTFWTGTPAQMADLTKAAFEEIRKCNPSAQVVAANTTSRATGSFGTFFPAYLQELKARGWPADAYSVHSYPTASGGADARIKGIAQFRTALALAGAPFTRIYDTEINYGLAGLGEDKVALSGDTAMTLIARTYIDSARYGFGSTFWFVWTKNADSKFGIQFTANAPAERQAWNTTYDWLVGSRFQRCLDASNGITVCQFSKGAENFSIVWHGDVNSAAINTAPGTLTGLGSRACTLKGSCVALTRDGGIAVGPMPIRIDGAPLTSGPTASDPSGPNGPIGPVGPLSTPVIITAPEVDYLTANTEKMTTAWTYPISGLASLPTGYEYEVRFCGTSPSACPDVIRRGTTNATTTGLSVRVTEGPGRYEFRVRATQGEQSSDWATASFRVLSTKALPPSDVTATTTSNAVTVKWNPPAVAASKIDSYEVDMTSVDPAIAWGTVTFRTKSTSLTKTLAELKLGPTSTFRFRVRTVLKGGEAGTDNGGLRSIYVTSNELTLSDSITAPDEADATVIVGPNAASVMLTQYNTPRFPWQIRVSPDGGATWRLVDQTSYLSPETNQQIVNGQLPRIQPQTILNLAAMGITATLDTLIQVRYVNSDLSTVSPWVLRGQNSVIWDQWSKGFRPPFTERYSLFPVDQRPAVVVGVSRMNGEITHYVGKN